MNRILKTSFFLAALLATQVFCSTDSAQTDTIPGPELRHQRRWAISGELGVNGLSSLIGPVFTWYAAPNIPLDLGTGLSAVGWRPGLRARYLFSQGKTAWFAGLGFKYGLGTAGAEAKVQDPDTKQDIKFKLEPSPFADVSMGMEFLANNGFLLILNGGCREVVLPRAVTELADLCVGWDERALVDAIRRQARHEETTRWDTIEFKIE